ncbi:uncharacterized protein LOC134801040 isoform X3 [Cydia splendana]|uniref:uncharacterized protein LOC134801040 isoform X3 n=1 Tax=Cydia splendana TaxID=1100963 RepID=UPI00300CDF41
MSSVCLCFVTIFVILIEIKALRRINHFEIRRINDYESFRSDINSDGRPILRGGIINDLTGNMDPNPTKRPALRGGLDLLAGVADSNPTKRPALRGGLDDLLADVDFDINVRLQPQEKQKNDQDSHHMSIPDDEIMQQNADYMRKRPSSSEDAGYLRKRPTSSPSEDAGYLPKRPTSSPSEDAGYLRKRPTASPSEDGDYLPKRPTTSSEVESDDDDGLPIMRTVMPHSSPENNDDSGGEQSVSLVREDDDSDEDREKYQRQKKEDRKKMPEWTKDLKRYIRILSSKFTRDGMISHIKPVIKVLERNHKVKIKDIDVNKRGRVKVTIKKL